MLWLLMLLAGVSGCSLVRHELRHLTGSSAERLADDVTIERDGWGVPHVHGRNDAAALFGLAYAMAEDNYWQIEEDMLFALGRVSHYHGESMLAHDVVRSAFEVEARARAEYGGEPQERRALWDAFAHGLNHYLQSHPEAPRRLLLRYEPWMLFARAAEFDAATLAGTLPLGTVAVEAGAPVAAPTDVQEVLVRGWGWAVPPGHSATGEPLLLAALEGPWYGTGQLYEGSLRSDTGWEVAGAFELGLPLLRAGHNQRAAWLEVAAAPPVARLQRLQFDHPSDSLLFRAGGDWQRAARREVTLHVNTTAGVAQRVVRFIDTPFGPVLRRHGDTAYAAQLAEGMQGGLLQRGLAMSRATSLEAFRAARSAAPLRWNTLYAGVDGSTAAWVDGAERQDGNGGLLLLGPAPRPERLASAGAWTAEALEQAAFDAFAPDAGAHILALVDEWERVGGGNPRRAAALDDAIATLREWDRRFAAPSNAALLYAAWLEEYGRGGDVDGAYGAFRALEAAVARLEREPASARTWGDALRLQRRHTGGGEAFLDSLPSLPFGAAPAGVEAGFRAEGRPGAGARRYAVAGRAWTAVVRLAQPPQARTVVPFGQSALVGSAHFQDQAPKFAGAELKELRSGGDPSSAEVRERYRPGRRARVLQQ